MTESRDTYEYERFKQEFSNRPQRRRLGIDLDQKAACAIAADEQAMQWEYQAWRARTGMPEQVPRDVTPRAKSRRSLWSRLTGR
jgi:hypothetical protein